MMRKFHKISIFFGMSTIVFITISWLISPVNTDSTYSFRLEVEADELSWSPNSEFIAIASHKEVSIWQLSTLQSEGSMPHYTFTASANYYDPTLSWSSDSQQIAAGNDNGVVDIYSIQSDELERVSVFNDGIYRVSWSINGDALAVSSGDSTKILESVEDPDGVLLNDLRHVNWANDFIVASADNIASLQILDIKNYSQHNNYYLRFAAISPNGTRIAGVLDNDVVVHDLPSGNLLSRSQNNHSASITALSWSPDGYYIASGSGTSGNDYSVRVWDVQNGDEISRIEGHNSNVVSIRWHNDEELIVTISSTGEVIVAEVSTSGIVDRFQVNGERYFISPNGMWIAAIDNGYVTIWRSVPSLQMNSLE